MCRSCFSGGTYNVWGALLGFRSLDLGFHVWGHKSKENSRWVEAYKTFMGLLRLYKGNVRRIRGSYPPETSLDVCPVSVKEFKPIRTLLIPFMWVIGLRTAGA